VEVWRTEDRQVNVAVYEQVEVQCGILASLFSAERHACSSHNYLTQISPVNGGLVGARSKKA
jgi:hypothetical protein